MLKFTSKSKLIICPWIFIIYVHKMEKKLTCCLRAKIILLPSIRFDAPTLWTVAIDFNCFKLCPSRRSITVHCESKRSITLIRFISYQSIFRLKLNALFSISYKKLIIQPGLQRYKNNTHWAVNIQKWYENNIGAVSKVNVPVKTLLSPTSNLEFSLSFISCLFR